MGKILKNFHWLIIAYAVLNLYLQYSEREEQYITLQKQEEIEQKELLKNKKSLKEINAYYKNIKEEKDKIEIVAKEIEKMQQLLPSEVSDSENINLLREMADEVNVKEISISPDKEQDKGFFISRNYKIVAKATYLQFLILFEKISENKRILNINEIKFKHSPLPQKGRFQALVGEFTIQSYRYNPAFKEDRGIEEIEKKFQDAKPAGGKNKKKAVEKGS